LLRKVGDCSLEKGKVTNELGERRGSCVEERGKKRGKVLFERGKKKVGPMHSILKGGMGESLSD